MFPNAKVISGCKTLFLENFNSLDDKECVSLYAVYISNVNFKNKNSYIACSQMRGAKKV